MPPGTPRVCVYCGSDATMVDHVDGNESHGNPENLAFSCRPCNTTKANVMHAAGIGTKTRQYNPPAKPAANLAQWQWAVSRIRRRDKRTGQLQKKDGWKIDAPAKEVATAVAMIRATPHRKRVEFAQQLQAKQRPRSRKPEDLSYLDEWM